jgi:collagenase-like PrtC family protease
MKLSVATNWNDKLLYEMSKREIKVYEIYGSLATGLIGSGRERQALPQVQVPPAKEHIALAHHLGIRFNYALNAPCLGNQEQTKEGRRQIQEHLELIVQELKVDAVIVTQPWLIELIRREFPEIEIVASVIIHVESVQMAKFYEELGITRLNISVMANRNFKLIQSIMKAVSCDVELLANETCLFRCPLRLYHYNSMGHTSQQQMEITQYCLLNCLRKKLGNPAELIKARWIRPEDIERYEALGIEFFKLEGREFPTSWLLRCVESYYHRKYEGNLADIIAFYFLPTNKLEPRSQRIVPPPSIYIDNQKLEGFLTFFEKNGDKCDEQCHKCSYCADIAEKTVTFDRTAVETYLTELGLLHANFLRSFEEEKEGVVAGA